MHSKNSYLLPQPPSIEQIFILALLAYGIGSVFALFIFYAGGIETEPVELMGTFAYVTDININARLAAVTAGLSATIVAFVFLLYSTIGKIIGNHLANLLLPVIEKLRQFSLAIFNRILHFKAPHPTLVESRKSSLPPLLMGLFFVLFLPSLVTTFTSPSLVQYNASLFPRIRLILLIVSYALVVSASLFFVSLWLKGNMTGLRRLLTYLQLLLLGAYYKFIPYPMFINGQIEYPFTTTVPTFLCGVFSVFGFIDVWRRRNNSKCGDLFSPIALFAIFLLWSDWGTLPIIWANMFELGSRLPQAYSILTGQLEVFVDLYITYGLSDLAFPLAGKIITGEWTALGCTLGYKYLLFLFNAILFLLLSRRLHVFIALLLIIVIPHAAVPIALAALILCDHRLCQRPDLWLIVWTVFSSILVFYTIPQGAMIVVASFPIAFMQFYTLCRMSIKRASLLLCIGIIFAIFLFVYPLGKYTWGLLRIVGETAQVNSGWAANDGDVKYFMRYSSYFLTPLLGFFAFYTDKKKSPSLSTTWNWILFTSLCIYLWVGVSYGFSRLDGSGARAGQLITTLLALVMLGCWLIQDRAKATINTIIILLFLYSIGTFTLPKVDQSTALKGIHKVLTIDTERNEYIDGDEIGIPRLGKGIFKTGTLKKSMEIKEALDKVLLPEETYLSLDSLGSIYYFLLGRDLLLEYPNPFVYPGDVPQKRALKALEVNNIRVSHIDISPQGDLFPILTWYLYRYAIAQGFPLPISDTGLLIMPAEHFKRVNQIPPTNHESIGIYQRYLNNYNIKFLPSTWGRGMEKWDKAINHTLIQDTPLVIQTGQGKHWELPLTSTLKGDENSHILLTFSGLLRDTPVTLSWDNGGITPTSSNTIQFIARNGNNLIPTDISPSWLLASKIHAVFLTSEDEAEYTLEKIALYHRKWKEN